MCTAAQRADTVKTISEKQNSSTVEYLIQVCLPNTISPSGDAVQRSLRILSKTKEKKLNAVRLDMEGFCPDKESTGRKMRDIRKANFLTVDDMKDLMDVKNISTIYRWENGKSLPDEDRLELFCLMFDLDPETFVVMKKKTNEICTKV